MPEKTGQQLAATTDTLNNPLPASYATYRTMRLHPTIALAKIFKIAPIVAAEWTTEVDEDAPEEAEELIQKVFLPVREPLIEQALEGGIDFGWQPFELVFDLVDGRTEIVKFKPLLHDVTTILIDGSTGAFNGFKQEHTNPHVTLPVENSLLINFQVEGSQWYGRSLLENARARYNEWVEANSGAARYDKKMAGSHFVVKYPPGSSKFNGVETDNFDIAESLIQTLTSSGSIAIPKVLAKFQDELSDDEITRLGWEIEVLSDPSPKQVTFVPRLEYLDVQMVRALLLPERSMLEGKHGTKAEAGVHSESALVHLDLLHRHMTRLINWHAVNRVLMLNFGEDMQNTVRLVASPLEDEQREFFKQVYTKLLSNPQALMDELDWLDTKAMRDQLALPSLETPKENDQGVGLPGSDPNDPMFRRLREGDLNPVGGDNGSGNA